MTHDERAEVARLLDALPAGAENAVPVSELTDEPGSAPRARSLLRKAAMELGVPVCSNTQGFFLGDSPAELQEYALSLFTRAYEIQKHADAIRSISQMDRARRNYNYQNATAGYPVHA